MMMMARPCQRLTRAPGSGPDSHGHGATATIVRVRVDWMRPLRQFRVGQRGWRRRPNDLRLYLADAGPGFQVPSP